MPMILDPNWQRGYLVPYGRNKRTGQGGLAVPGVIQDFLSALMLPGDVYQGKMPLLDPQTGRTSDQVIKGSADLAGMMTLGSGAIPAQPNSLRMGIKAYHGSPHDFDRFSMDKIGTGEGAQAYGHGLYFAENEGVARSYRDALSPVSIDGKPVDYSAGSDLASSWFTAFNDRTKAADYLQRQIDNPPKSLPNLRSAEEIQAMADAVAILRGDAPISKTVGSGRMYEVNIDANPDDFLDWDAPLNKQPEAVRRLAGWTPEAEAQYRAASASDADNLFAALDGGPDYSAAKLPRPQGAMPYDTTGGAFYESSKLVPGEYSNKVAAAQRLKEAGIPGIKYLDAGSRSAGDGSRNYVVFDDKLISIVKKYGVAALVAAGVLDQVQGEELKARGYN